MDRGTLLAQAFNLGAIVVDAERNRRRRKQRSHDLRDLGDRYANAVGGSPALPAHGEQAPAEASPASTSDEIATERTTPQDRAPAVQEQQTGTACVTCIKDHFSRVAGVLTEALRFARSEGMYHPEVTSRLSFCEDEINTGEALDGAPAKLAALEPEARELMEQGLPKLREIRHRMNQARTVQELEDTAAYAQTAKMDFRAHWLTLPLKALGEASEEDRERLAARMQEIATEGSDTKEE